MSWPVERDRFTASSCEGSLEEAGAVALALGVDEGPVVAQRTLRRRQSCTPEPDCTAVKTTDPSYPHNAPLRRTGKTCGE